MGRTKLRITKFNVCVYENCTSPSGGRILAYKIIYYGLKLTL